MNQGERAARSARLHDLMSNGDVRDAIESVEVDLVAEWRACFDPAERENLWHTLRAFDRLTSKLTNWATSDIKALAKGR